MGVSSMTLETQKEDSECAYLVHEESLPAGTSYKSPPPPDQDATRIYKAEDEEEGPTLHSIAKFHERLLEQVRNF
ncbi:synaptic vesicle glycoprotein 2C [Trichonephila clavipes]|nr:synaptic vesicle glycoprotein 2C [Trichonephila clavipes]